MSSFGLSITGDPKRGGLQQPPPFSDADRTISPFDLQTLTREALGEGALSEDQFKGIIERIGTDKSGNIIFDKFLDLMSGLLDRLVSLPPISRPHPVVQDPLQTH